jgi:hypothetical protein
MLEINLIIVEQTCRLLKWPWATTSLNNEWGVRFTQDTCVALGEKSGTFQPPTQTIFYQAFVLGPYSLGGQPLPPLAGGRCRARMASLRCILHNKLLVISIIWMKARPTILLCVLVVSLKRYAFAIAKRREGFPTTKVIKVD